jgi:flagellar motor switch protein FliM
MSKILSQEEVDSLLTGIGEGKVETGKGLSASEGALSRYDFTKEYAPVQLKMPALGLVNERFISFVKNNLSVCTGSSIDAALTETNSMKFDEFCRSLPLPASLNVFKMEPLRGLCLLALDGPLVFAFIDAFFGGKAARQVKIEGKGFTPIELRIVGKIVHVILNGVEHAWAPVHPVKTSLVRTEMDPQFAAITSPGDLVLAIKFSIELGNFSGVGRLCIPHPSLEPLKEKMKERFQSERIETDAKSRQFIEQTIRELKVTLSCTLGTARITGRQLLGMKVDDVIPLDKGVEDLLVIRAEGIPKFKGYLGSSNEKQAIRIDRIIAEGRS